MFSSRSTSVLFRPLKKVASASTLSSVASVRWTALYPKEQSHLRFLKRSSVHNYYDTEVDASKLDGEYGVGTSELFFSEDAVVDFNRLFTMEYEDLNGRERLQRKALYKELKDTVASLCLRIDIGKAIHERNTDELSLLIGDSNSPVFSGIKNLLSGKKGLYEHLANLPPAHAHEITYISDHEFVHYPFLGPFKFKSLCRIANQLREKLDDMPHNFAGVLGTIPVALNEKQARDLGIEMQLEDEHKADSLYLFNIAVIVTGHGSITFVPKRTPSSVDLRYPIIKYVMHDGRLYEDCHDTVAAGQQVMPTLGSRKLSFSGHTTMDLPTLTKTNSRIVQAKVGDGFVYIVPEICLENLRGVAVNTLHDEFLELERKASLFKESSFTLSDSVYVLHTLIAYGLGDLADENMVSQSVYKHDKSPGITFIKSLDHGTNIAPIVEHDGEKGITLALFDVQTLSAQKLGISSENATSKSTPS